MKTFHIDTEKGWRGGEQQALYLMKGLVRRGHEVSLAAQPGSPLASRAKAEGIRTLAIPMRGEGDLLAIWRLRRALNATEPAVVHMHTSHAHTLGCLAASLPRNNGVKTVVSRRVDFSILRSPLSRFKYTHGVDRFICISEAIKEVMIEGGVPGELIDIVPSGIDTGRFENVKPADLRKEFNLPAESCLLGNVAHFADHKGHRFLVDAFAQVAARVESAHMILVGVGELKGAVEHQVRSLGIESRVIFAGFREDIPEVLAGFDLFVMGSHLEGLCTSIMDAMATGIPVVATTAGGIPEIIDTEKEGLLVPPRDPAALAQAILRVVEDAKLAQDLGQSGREKVQKHFSADRMVERTLEIYNQLAGERGTSQRAA